MNQQAYNAIRKQGQAGFTLIELIVVIVILGILAATALPRFGSLGGDARVASLNAARGALQSTSAMVRGQFLVNPSAVTAAGQVVNEGVTIPVVNGYPSASTGFANGAGLTATDYTIATSVAAAAATATVPAIPANGMVIIPNSVAGTATALTCFVSYTQAAANGQPAFGGTIGPCQ